MSSKEGILLESGTNELEIVEFGIGTNKFGINVIKVKEIINPVNITVVPQSHASVEGIIKIRGEVVPVIDMAKVLGFPESENPNRDKFIVCEFNKTKVVFHVHTVTQIHRISWNQIEKPNSMYSGLEGQIIGVIHMNEDMVLLLDYEKIVVDINPEAGISAGRLKHLGERQRSNKRILIAEDSALLRKLLEETLEEAGYTNVTFVENGDEALTYLEKVAQTTGDISEEVQLVITDIEMPKMDGHHLTKRIKDHKDLQKLPVVIFSSLITDELKHRGDMVGANEQVSKPEVDQLVLVIDKLIL